MGNKYLFRGLRPNAPGFIFGCLFDFDSPTDYCTIHENNKDADFFRVRRDTVGQLLHTERNGQQWFEGDIAEIEVHLNRQNPNGWSVSVNGKATGIVQMHPRHGLCIKDYHWEDYDDDFNSGFRKGQFKTITFSRSMIIGNIHENPELMRKEATNES